MLIFLSYNCGYGIFGMEGLKKKNQLMMLGKQRYSEPLILNIKTWQAIRII